MTESGRLDVTTVTRSVVAWGFLNARRNAIAGSHEVGGSLGRFAGRPLPV